MSVDLDVPNEGPTQTEKSIALPPALENLSKLVGERPEALATGSDDLRKAALDATKFIFDLALTTEQNAVSKVNDLLTSISPSHAPQTRSQAAEASRKRKRGSSPSPAAMPPLPSLQETPIAELFVDGMSDEQIWAELELRAQNVCNVLDYALDGPVHEGESGENEESEEDEEAEENELKKMRQALIDEGFDPDELEGMGFDESGEEDSEEDEDDDEEEEEEEEDASEEDADGSDDGDLGEDVEELRDPSDEEDNDEADLEADEPSFLSGRNRTLKYKLKPKRGGHAVLDDGFFDLAAFNAEIEAAETKNVSRGKLSKDDDDDEDDDDAESVDYFAPVDDTAAFDEEDLEEGGELFYKDFFEPPSRQSQKAKKPPKGADQPPSSTGKVRFHEEVKVRKIKAKGKNLPVSTMFYEEEEDDDGGGDEDYEDEEGIDFDEDDDSEMDDKMDEEEMLDDDSEEEDGDVSMGDDEDEQSGLATMERLKDDLFADDEETDVQEGLSTYEKRMAALREEISTLEAENVGKKDWTLLGEATSRTRPQNSLLEEDLEFERIMKSVPVITEEVVHSLEERIRARILDNQFDDVVRKRPVDDKPFLPSRFFELQDTKSKQSLAEIYEDEYTAAQTGGVAGSDRDGKLKKEHQEIEKLWEHICSKLDALCNAHFTPKAPKATITSVSNVAAATLESALPTTKATSTMLAPEEVYAPASDLRARSELTPVEKRALRNKQKKANKKARDAIDKSVQKFGRPKGLGDVKRQKEAALKTLVKSGKGVTVIGKKSNEVESQRGRGKT
ncbi:Mpp10 protein [Lentinus tigrinus ALCF2SS1-7]|uniref:Mpp10 protein n=1 Tax=Lentinus tigrinus ALCF2SS1-7 TaxID=1328758 RepID=UPI0011662A1D|nr:Mpp10 protein [Lentinus tigrinus ALCF2SS1-7]